MLGQTVTVSASARPAAIDWDFALADSDNPGTCELTLKTDVIILGAGPTGLTLALLLNRAGIRTLLIERNREPQRHPAACILNTRTLEVFREIGVDSAVLEQAQNVFERANITWVTTLNGRELGQCSAIPEDLESMLAASPVHATHFPQNRLEPLLWDRVRDAELVEFRTGIECTDIRQTEESVQIVAERSDTGEGLLVEAPFMVACDGASSPTRRLLGIPASGPILQNILGVYFTADLGALTNHRKSILYWILNPEILGVLIAQWLPSEWVLFVPYFPPQQTPEDFGGPECTRLVQAAVGHLPDDLEVKLVRPWVLSAKLADRYREGRVFIAGDAAHTFPPTGGLGLNTGVQDAHNLAWKLSAVLTRGADDQLLESYERERRPVACANLEHSVANYENMNELTEVVGLNIKHLAVLRRIQHNGAFQLLPTSWQKAFVQAAVRLAVGRLARFDDDGRRGETARNAFLARIPGQEPHYRFSGLDLGFAYREGAILFEAWSKSTGSDSVIHYRPTTSPGARLPHFWVNRGGERISIHDALAPDALTVLTHSGSRNAWSGACSSSDGMFPLRVHCLSIGNGTPHDLRDLERAWPALSEIGDDGAVVVRPDGHVAARTSRLPEDPAGWLRGVLAVVCPALS